LSTLSKAENGICLSIQAFSRELKCCRKRLGEKVKSAGLKPAGAGPTGYPTYRLADIVAMLLSEALERSATGGDPDKWSPRDRLAHFRGENERLKLEAAQGLLVPLEAFENTLSKTFKSLILGLETLPDVVELNCGLNADQVAVMLEIIDAQRQQLYQSLLAPFDE